MSLISFNFNDISNSNALFFFLFKNLVDISLDFDGSVDIVALVKDVNEGKLNYDLVLMYNKYSVSPSNLCAKFKKFPYEHISLDSAVQITNLSSFPC